MIDLIDRIAETIVRIIYVIFTAFLSIKLFAYITKKIFIFYLDTQQIELTLDQRFIVYQTADAMQFYGFILLLMFFFLLPKLRKKIIFY